MKKQEIAEAILNILGLEAEADDLSTGSTVTKQTWQKILERINELKEE